MRGFGRTFTDMRGFGRTFTDMRGFGRTFTDMRGFGRTFTDMRGFECTFTDIRGFECTFTDMRGFECTFTDIRGFECTFTDIRGFGRTCCGVPANAGAAEKPTAATARMLLAPSEHERRLRGHFFMGTHLPGGNGNRAISPCVRPLALRPRLTPGLRYPFCFRPWFSAWFAFGLDDRRRFWTYG